MGVNAYIPALQIIGYKLERDNLIDANVRTRTAVYIADYVTYRRRTDLEISQTPIIWLEISVSPAKSWLIMIGYRQWRCLTKKKHETSGSISAQCDRFKMWCNSWKKAEYEGKDVTIIGDLNIDVLPWSNSATTLSSHQQTMTPLLRMMKEEANCLNFSLIKTEPTRFQGPAAPSTLDIILTNHPELIKNTQLLQSSSDHKIIMFSKNIKKRPTSNYQKSKKFHQILKK